MTLYVAVDIGCIECGEDSAVLGVFTTEGEAKEVAEEHMQRHEKNWHGQHHFDVFEVSNVGVINRIEYANYGVEE